ncbi:hypothetical protein NAV28_05920 [Pseudomonas stutzeri]|nr:hypothetical protein [Stutzerimonas degradans]
MISQFLQFGYLGLLALLIVLCYRVIEGSTKSQRPFKETLIILVFFSLISLVGGGTGYLWASKELEVAKTKESTAAILKQQVNAMREAHLNSMLPLQVALNNAAENLSESVLSSNRQEHIAEINQINSAIQARESQFSKTISDLNGAFNQVAQ